MGALFKLDHANIMAFVTSRSHGAPRVRRDEPGAFASMRWISGKAFTGWAICRAVQCSIFQSRYEPEGRMSR